MRRLLFVFLIVVYLSVAQKIAPQCDQATCLIQNNCRCSSNSNPIDPATAPQLIALTFDESVVDNIFRQYWEPLLFSRVNPDGKPIRGTFFVPHEYTDYERVQQIYLQGFEIGVHSITKNVLQSYWRNASLELLIQEFGGQREIISHFANIPIEDIIGGRTPQLQIVGDVTMDAYSQSGLIYDNSWPTLSTKHLLPYTLDYLSTQDCLVTIECPRESHNGFWIVPITNIKGNGDVECNSLVTCDVSGTADEIATWLFNQVESVRSTNRAPINFRIDSYWFFFTANSYDGLVKFLDMIADLPDIFLVSQSEVIEWMKNPRPLADYATKPLDRVATCNAINCELRKEDDTIRYMKSCVACPAVYPWLGNPFGNSPF